jgi:hypothetical protein
MKGEKKYRIIKVDPELHQAVKTYCAKEGELIQDFCGRSIFKGLPTPLQVEIVKKQRKAR